MSNADEMFEKLGFFQTENNQTITYYFEGNRNHYIRFTKKGGKTAFPRQIKTSNFYISMQELQAINEKVKELGWNKE